MPRIFKGSESTLRLLISKTGDYQALTEIKIKLYTTDIENAIEIIDGIQVCKNIATITLAPRAFMGMEDGLINYIIDGATEDDVFHTERQSNYMLKSLSYINEDGVATQTMTIESNGEYRVTPNDGLYVDINVNVPDINGSYDDGFNAGYDQGKTDGVNEQKSKLESINITENGTYTKEDGYNQIEVNVLDLNGSYDEGYAQGKTDGINEQKGKLESISITENGVYSKEDGYNHIEVNVPDCNLINPIVFSEKGGNTINAENVQIPTFVYEGNQYYNVGSFNLADIEEFKIHILFKPNNSGDAEPINIFGCEDTDWDNTTFGARIYQGQITFRMSGQEVVSPYTENTWYDVEMGYNTTKRWVILNGETLYENTHAFFNKPRQTLMIGAINSGGNAFRPFYGKIAAIYIKSNGNQVWLLPKKDGTMSVYWNDRNNTRNSISGENNARFENDYISGDGMKSITWLGNLEDKWVTPSMSDRDGNGYIVVYPSEGYNSLKRTVINPQTLYNEGVNEQKSKLESINITENGTYDREDGYNHIEVNVIPKINVKEAGLKFAYSTFTEVPEWADFEGITDMSYMFSECKNIQTISLIDTSNITNMNNMFSDCSNLQTIPQIDTSNVTNMRYMFSDCNRLQTIPQLNTSKVTDMTYMFNECQNLQKIPQIDTSKVTNAPNMFTRCFALISIPALDFRGLEMSSYDGFFGWYDLPKITDFGGFLNLKCSLTNDKNLQRLPNLTKESCINVLNGLYDFTGNGETPNSEQGQLKVHQNFLDKVGDEISIGTAKGWQITA